MKQARTLNDKQLKLVFAHCATRRHAARDRAIVAVSFMAGLRAKEIAALKIGDVCDDEKKVREEFILSKEQTKGNKARRVFVCKKLKKELEIYLGVAHLRAGCSALFQSQKGVPFSPNTMCQLFLNIYRQAGMDGASSHTGRRSLLTALSQKGISVRVISEIAGHSSIVITQKYLDVNDEHMRAAIESI